MASYPIRAEWFGWDGAAAGGGGAKVPPVTIDVGGREYMLDDITPNPGGGYRIQASPIDPYPTALFIDGVYMTDGTGSGWSFPASKGITPGPHQVIIGEDSTSGGSGVTDNDLANATKVYDFGMVVFPPALP
jgi:hypothetical protein